MERLTTRNGPKTFGLPERRWRESLQPGDLAKLIFRINVYIEDDSIAVERMWVLVRELVPGGYLGVLGNEPTSVAENDDLWIGTELPFSAKHVIDVGERDAKSIALAQQEPRRRWSRG